MLEAALEDRRRWAREGLDHIVAVNVAAGNLVDPAFPTEVARLLNATATSPERLKLEITESAIMSDPDCALGVLHELAGMGIELAIDDFGTGYSSLAYLRRMPVAELKIDRSFVLNMDTNPGDQIIVRSTIDLAQNLGLRVLAEGVETRESRDELRRLGCDGAQGYFFSRPVPAERVAGTTLALEAEQAPRRRHERVA